MSDGDVCDRFGLDTRPMAPDIPSPPASVIVPRLVAYCDEWGISAAEAIGMSLSQWDEIAFGFDPTWDVTEAMVREIAAALLKAQVEEGQ
jgi:hypothetical protein